MDIYIKISFALHVINAVVYLLALGLCEYPLKTERGRFQTVIALCISGAWSIWAARLLNIL